MIPEPRAAAPGLAFVPRAEEDAAGRAPASWPMAPAAQVEAVLRLHDTPERLVQALLELVPAETEDGEAALEAVLAAGFAFKPWPLLLRRGPLVLIGPPGAGKTLLAAKLAARLRRSAVRLATADLERPGRREQLGEFATALGFPLAATPDEALAADRGEMLIIDTPGVRSRDRDELARLGELVATLRGSAVLVLPAGLDAAEAAAEADAFRDLGATHLILARADLARRLGGALAAVAASGLAFAGTSFAPHFAYGLRPLTPRILARRLLSAALDDRRWRPA